MSEEPAARASNQFTSAEQYQYDQQGLAANVTTDDFDANSAQALTGYDPRIKLQHNWPGLEVDPNQLRLDPEALADVAQKLRAKAMELSSLPSEVAAGTRARFGPDVWPQVVKLRSSSATVSQVVSDHLQRVVKNLNEAAGAIEIAIQRYMAGEQANDASARNMDSDLGGGQAPVNFNAQ
jgi:hypothetical protein